MTLKMKDRCEKCHAVLSPDGTAFICSYECTYCAECTRQMQHTCPTCGGELTRRPKRKPVSP